MLRSAVLLGVKVLLRRKFFTFVSLFAVAFTLLVLVVAAALVDHVLGPHPPETRPDRTLVVVTARLEGKESRRTGWAGWRLLDRGIRDLPGAEAATIASMPRKITTYHEGRKVVLYSRKADGAFWSVYRFDFVEGAPYDESDEAQARPVAVLNESARDRFFGGGPAVGRTIELDGRGFRVVGVVRDVPFTRMLTFADVWTPVSTLPSDGYRRDLAGDFVGAVLLRPGADREAARSEFQARAAALPIEDPRFDRLETRADTPFDAVARAILPGDPMADRGAQLRLILAAAALLFMALPALNLVNLNLSRILERASEIGVRKSFGATSRSLVGQFLIENVVLTLAGGVLGTAAAAAVLASLNASGVIPYAHLAINLRVLGWGLLMALAFGVLSGVLPAWRMSRLHPARALAGRL